MWDAAILWAHKVLTLREGRCCRRDGAGPLPEEEDLHPWLYLWPGRNHREWINSHVVYSLSCVRPFATLWTVVDQAPPSTGFPRQEYWSGLPFPSPGDLPHPGIEPRSPGSPMLVSEFFTTVPPVVNFSATKNKRTNYCCVTTGMSLKTLMLHERTQIPKTRCCHFHAYTILEKTKL